MTQTTVEQLTLSGNLLQITLFEQKLMKNFIIINNKLKKLEEISQLDSKQKNTQKQLKFLSLKVDTLIQKIPHKDNGSLNKTEIRLLIKDQISEMFNSEDQKIMKTKVIQQIENDLQFLREQFLGKNLKRKNSFNGGLDLQRNNTPVKTTFTAGQALMIQSNRKMSMSKETQNILDQSEKHIIQKIIDEEEELSFEEQMRLQIEKMYRKIEQVRLGTGISSLIGRDIQRFERYEQFEQKSQGATRNKEKSIKLQGIRKQNIKGQILKNQLYADYQKNQLMKQEKMKQDSMLKTSFINKGHLTQNTFKRSKQQGRENLNNLHKRQNSLKKLQRIDRKLKLDDIKDINIVLKQIQLQIDGKVNHEIFMGFVQDFQEKLEILRITKDTSNDINQLRKTIYNLDGKIQSVVTYLQNLSSEEDALLVRKQWNCVSCDKNLDKYNGKIGAHLNWDVMNSKKISPTKIGAFGQTGQLASKIKSLMNKQSQ